MTRFFRKMASAVILLLPAIACAQRPAAIDWGADLDFLARELPARHYNLFTVKSEAYFLAAVERIREKSPQLGDFGTAAKMQQLIASMGDSHTSLDIGPLIEKNQTLPLVLHWFGDGLFVVSAPRNASGAIGCEIVSINGFETAVVADSLATLITADNVSMVRETVPRFIPSVQILEFFGLAPGGRVKLGCRGEDGQTRFVPIEPGRVDRNEMAAIRPDSTAFCDANRRPWFTEHFFGGDDIYYLQYNRCLSREIEEKYGDRKNAAKMPSFKEFEKKVFRTLEREPVGKIVLDLRYNGGGNSSQGTAFIEQLSEYLDRHPETKFYVVLGRNTFSSAILNAMDARKMTGAVFVGEATAGKPNHFGEVRSFRLPSSGLDVQYSTKYFKRSDEDTDTLAPDVAIERTFGDFMRGVDPVFEWIRVQ